MDLLAPRGKINKLRMETEQIGSAMKILLELKKEIVSKVEETKIQSETSARKNPPKQPARPLLLKTGQYLSWTGELTVIRQRCPNTRICIMSSSDDVAALMLEIRKEFERSLSLLNLRVLDQTDFDIPE